MINKIMAVLLCLGAAIINYVGDTKDFTDEQVLRLHVLANSNSVFDQSVKLKVKDEVSKYMAQKGVSSFEDAIYIANAQKDEIIKTANRVLKENGADYTAQVELGEYYFPKRTYNDLTFKEGNYNAVRLKLGKAEGENWWCVMFPPLCLLDSGAYGYDISSQEQVQFKSLIFEVLE